MMRKRKLFCEISPICYQISMGKEWLLRDIRDFLGKDKFAGSFDTEALPALVKKHSSSVMRRLHGVDMQLQKNKATNLQIALQNINGLIIRPGETFSFWRCVGNPTARKGYAPGLVIENGNISLGIGGGLCQLANLIHWLVLHSPLTETELHHHSDALFPDSGRRVPFGTGTSVCYKNVDYRFQNTTAQPVQLLIWMKDMELFGELRTTTPFPYTYRITEHNQGFTEEDGVFYRVSQVYRIALDKRLHTVEKELILDNHSKVMYDYSLIPEDKIITPGFRRLASRSQKP